MQPEISLISTERPPAGADHADLISQVLSTAISDAQGVNCRKQDREDAVHWLRSDDNSVGSFRWYCSLLGIDPDDARDRMRQSGVID